MSTVVETATFARADAPAAARRPRLDAVDLLRGLVIALMVLDHTRDFFHAQAFTLNPTDPARTTLVLYLTRWAANLCAPTFVFLAGVSIELQRANGKTPAELSRFLLTRGLWLIALELTVVGFGFNFAWPFAFLQVIWAIGLGMVAMAALTRLPRAAVLALGALIVAGHDALDSVRVGDLGAFASLWTLAMALGPAPFGTGFVAYPFVPWFGILCLGYGLGPVFLRPAGQRRRLTALLGVGCLALFVVLRFVNGYGDPSPWHAQAEGWRTALAFFDVGKYPPSLLYVLVMLGTSLLLALGLERLRGPLADALLAYGRTPLFTYLLHIYLVHGLAMAIGMATGVPASAFRNFIADPSRLVALHWGFGLPVVYAIWLAVLAALYPASRWYARLKRQRHARWMSYL